MEINVKDVCKKLYDRILDINVGSEEGEDIFTDAINKSDIISEAKVYLNNFNNNIISITELKDKLMQIEIENDIDNIDSPFIEHFSTIGTQLYWIFDDMDEFKEFLYQEWEEVLESNSVIRQKYRDYKKDFDNL